MTTELPLSVLLNIAAARRQELLARQPYQCGPRYGQWLADLRK